MRVRIEKSVCHFYTVGFVMLIWETADHILIDFQTVLSQKHIITCQSIYNAALVKNEQYSFFSSNLAEGWETVGEMVNLLSRGI